jgi:hypothetical protein
MLEKAAECGKDSEEGEWVIYVFSFLRDCFFGKKFSPRHEYLPH